jgi:hypothetical protein
MPPGHVVRVLWQYLGLFPCIIIICGYIAYSTMLSDAHPGRCDSGGIDDDGAALKTLSKILLSRILARRLR